MASLLTGKSRRCTRRSSRSTLLITAFWGVWILLAANEGKAKPADCKQGRTDFIANLIQHKHSNCYHTRNQSQTCLLHHKRCCSRSDCGHAGYTCECDQCGYYICKLQAGVMCEMPSVPLKAGHLHKVNNTAIRLVCKKRYYRVGPEIRVCQQNKRWSGKNHNCRRYCKFPKFNNFLNLNYTATRADRRIVKARERISIECNTGYYLYHSKTELGHKDGEEREMLSARKKKKKGSVQCNTKGRLFPRVRHLACLPKCCKVPTLSNGIVTPIGFAQTDPFCWADRVNFSCKRCYNLRGGPSVMSCKQLKSGKDRPTCKRLSSVCPNFSLPLGAIFKQRSKTFQCGSKLSISCKQELTEERYVKTGTYECNPNGVWEQDSQKPFQCAPGRVRSVRIIETTSNRIVLGWKPPQIMAEFVTYYKAKLTAGSSKPKQTILVNASSDHPEREIQVTFDDVQAGYIYILAVKAFVAENNGGKQSNTLRVELPLYDPPGLRSLTCKSTETGLRAAWQPSGIRSHRVRHYKVQLSSRKPINRNEYVWDGVNFTRATHFTWSTLQPHTAYTINVTMITSDNRTASMSKVCSHTPQHFQLQKPSMPVLEERNATHAKLLITIPLELMINFYKLIVQHVQYTNGLGSNSKVATVADTWNIQLPAAGLPPGKTVEYVIWPGPERTLQRQNTYQFKWRSHISNQVHSAFSDRLEIPPFHS